MIQTPQGENILIDCGQSYEVNHGDKKISFDAAQKFILPYLQHHGINRIDLMVLTHPDSDHIGGFQSLQDKVSIREVIDSGQYDPSPVYSKVFETILKNDIPLKEVKPGNLYQENNLSLDVINDLDPKATEEKDYNNNNGIGLKLTYGKNSFLFMADLEKEAEEKLISSNKDIKAQVLKVGHHGSKTSSTEEFIRYVRPEIAIVSVGANNRYGHPSKDVIRRLENFGSQVFRTDKDGGIVIKSDGDKLETLISK